MKIHASLASCLLILLFAANTNIRATELDPAQKAFQMLDERGLGPAVKILCQFLVHAISQDYEKAYEILPCSNSVRKQITSDVALKSLAGKSGNYGPIELVAFKFVSSSVFEFLFIIPTSDGPTGFRMGFSTYQTKGRLSYFEGSSEWNDIMGMADSYQILPATISLKPSAP